MGHRFQSARGRSEAPARTRRARKRLKLAISVHEVPAKERERGGGPRLPGTASKFIRFHSCEVVNTAYVRACVCARVWVPRFPCLPSLEGSCVGPRPLGGLPVVERGALPHLSSLRSPRVWGGGGNSRKALVDVNSAPPVGGFVLFAHFEGRLRGGCPLRLGGWEGGVWV